jgi:hypothetical protein
MFTPMAAAATAQKTPDWRAPYPTLARQAAPGLGPCLRRGASLFPCEGRGSVPDRRFSAGPASLPG